MYIVYTQPTDFINLEGKKTVINIINVGSTHPDEGTEGWHKYELYINKQFITSFTHRRLDGLAECMHAAWLAVSAYEKEKKLTLASSIIISDNEYEDVIRSMIEEEEVKKEQIEGDKRGNAKGR